MGLSDDLCVVCVYLCFMTDGIISMTYNWFHMFTTFKRNIKPAYFFLFFIFVLIKGFSTHKKYKLLLSYNYYF